MFFGQPRPQLPRFLHLLHRVLVPSISQFTLLQDVFNVCRVEERLYLCTVKQRASHRLGHVVEGVYDAGNCFVVARLTRAFAPLGVLENYIFAGDAFLQDDEQ